MKSMLLLHLASLWSRKIYFAICAFIFLMLCIVMSFAGWFETQSSCVFAGWVLLMLWNYGGLYLLTANNHGRSEFFLAIGLLKTWCFAEMIAHGIISAMFITCWFVCMAVGFGELAILLKIAGCMGLYSAIFAHASLGNLQPRIIGLPTSRKMVLFTVVSAPWALASWILGGMACRSLLDGESAQISVLSLILLAIIHVLLGVVFREDAAQRRQE